MHITDREKEELKRLIDAGEPLPARYKLRLFADAPEVELMWQGKTSEVTSVVLPFQSIEHIDEPRRAAGSDRSAAGSSASAMELRESATPLELGLQYDSRGRQQGGWTNKLVWGDNRLILSALKNGPVRREIEAAGGLKLIYIDPPFDVGADFSVNLEVGEETLTKEPSVIEELAYIEAQPKVKGLKATVSLQSYAVFYRQDELEEVAEGLKPGGSKVTVENGQVVKLSKDKKGVVTREVLTKRWTDWVDYWAVDFNFESKEEMVRVVESQIRNPKSEIRNEQSLLTSAATEAVVEREVWTGNYIFENEWQSFRTKKDRSLELTSAEHEYPKKGKYRIAVKVIDIFGNDTTKVVEVSV